ncbi:MAG: MFS transporter [Actinobacteria bacterium]|nr:MFS transporter [Actinomycetota bacterium]
MGLAAVGEPVRFGTGPGRWVLLAAVLGSGMVFLDGTVVNVALPRLGDDLGADFAGLQWVVNGYLLTLAAFVLLGGSLGDRLGRRRIFVLGLAWFTAASLLCGLAPTIPVLVAARLAQGVGGALLTPASLAMLQTSFHPDDRARAIGAWSALAGVTTAVGPFLGGWLVEAATWRWVFLLNLPLAVVAGLVALRHVPESVDPTVEGRLDVAGATLGAAGLAALSFGLIEGAWAIGFAGLTALVVFVGYERRARHPMLPLGIFASRQFSAANAVTFAVYAALGVVLFLFSLVLQRALGYRPLEAGLATLPITLVMLAFSSRAGALAQRIGPRLPMTVGPLLLGAGLVLMVRVGPGTGYVASVLPAVLVMAAGLTLTVAPLTATVLAAADVRHAGVASGVNNAVARAGGLLAVAAVPLVAGIDPSRMVPPAELVEGFHRAMVVAAGLTAGAGALAWTTIRADVLAEAEVPAGEAPLDQRRPCLHCGASAPPQRVHAHPGA